MAWLALGNSVGWRSGGRDALLRRPALGREICRNLAKVFLREALGYGRHDRAHAITAPKVVQLLDEITLRLTPDDRDGFWVCGYAVFTVAGAAHLHFCFDFFSSERRCG